MSEIKNPNLPMTDDEIDELLERFDKTEPAFQRKIVAMFMSNAVYFQMVATELLAACNALRDSMFEIRRTASLNSGEWKRMDEAVGLGTMAIAKAEGRKP